MRVWRMPGRRCGAARLDRAVHHMRWCFYGGNRGGNQREHARTITVIRGGETPGQQAILGPQRTTLDEAKPTCILRVWPITTAGGRARTTEESRACLIRHPGAFVRAGSGVLPGTRCRTLFAGGDIPTSPPGRGPGSARIPAQRPVESVSANAPTDACTAVAKCGARWVSPSRSALNRPQNLHLAPRKS